MTHNNNNNIKDQKNKVITVTQYGTDFRKVTKIELKDIPSPNPQQILVQNHFVVCFNFIILFLNLLLDLDLDLD